VRDRRQEEPVLFRQLYDPTSSTYSYLLASRPGGEALIIDPVLERVDRYIQLLSDLELKLVKAVDTHLHADHITGLGELRDRTRCITVMGEHSRADVVSMRVSEGERIEVEGISLDVLYTPGHTRDSYSFVLPDRVFTGDTLLIRGTGRTDFQEGDPRAQYDSIFGKLLRLPDETLVYPAHDYKGDTVSTVGEERAHNPRLKVRSVDEYVAVMNALNLPNPKMMDVAVPANMRVGLRQADIFARGWAVTAAGLMEELPRGDLLLVDLREAQERERHGRIASALHAPYPALAEQLAQGGMLQTLADATGKRIVFFCAYGERSAMAVEMAHAAGFTSASHLHGGLDAWVKAGGALAQ
jgi:sulfur dioxygenase